MAQYTQSYPTLSEAAYNNLFRFGNQPGQPVNPLQGNYQGVVDAANRAGVPPSLLAAIMAQETGFGRYNADLPGGGRIYSHNNPAGLMDPATNWSTPLRYNSFQAGLDAAAQTAARIYQRGGTVLPTIQNIYAPTDPQPANDPFGRNRTWLPNVTRFLRNIAGTMSPADYEALLPGLLASDFESLETPEMRAGSPGFQLTNEGWVPGDVGENVGPGTGLDSPLPYAGTGLSGPSLQQWLADPEGGQRVAGLSAQSGYTLPPDVVEFLGRTVPELGRGPEGFSNGQFPWFTPGRISEDVGEILQHHALMPNNLVFNPESQAWDVPQERRYPSNVGIWGAQRVADWLPSSSPGFEHDYLQHLGYGAPNPGVLGNFMGQTPGINTLGIGNQGWGNIGDMSTPGHTPFDYTQWLNALGTGGVGNPGNLGSGFDMNLYNQTAGIGGTTGDYQPDFSVAGPSGFPIDYLHYFATAGLPSGGYGGGHHLPVGASPSAEEDAYTVGSIDGGGSSFPPQPGFPTGQVGVFSWTIPSITNYYGTGGIGPGGIDLASGINTSPILTYGTSTGGTPLALGAGSVFGGSMGGMAAQPGASATGSMGGSHDQPADQPPPMGSIAAGAPPPEWLEQFKKQQQGFGRGMGALFAQY